MNINMYHYLDCHMKEDIHGLQFRVNLQFGSYEEEGESELQLCTKEYEYHSWPDDDELNALQQILDDLRDKYGEPDTIHGKVDLDNIYEEKVEDRPVQLEWDEGVFMSTTYIPGKFYFLWREMSDDYYARRPVG